MAVRVDLRALPRLTNPVYYPLHRDRSRYLVLYGGAGSGKSVFAAQKLVVRTLTEPGHKILVLRKVAKTLRNSAFAQVQAVIAQWGLGKLFRANKSDLEIRCINGSQFIFAGLDDAEKLKSITGITAVWIEEASELTQDDFTQVDLRLRGLSKHYKQIILTFNPISVTSWLKARWFDRPDPEATVLKTTYQDNRFLDDAYIRVLEGLKDKDHVYYQIYALGNWGQIGNLILTNYVIEEIPTNDRAYGSVYGGLDFGFNDPSAFLKIGWKDSEIWVLAEVYKRGLTNAELIEEIRPVVGIGLEITADSAEPARIKEARQAGLRVRPAKKGPDSVKASLDWLRRHRIHIHPACVHTIAEIQGYKYREDKDGHVLEEPVDFENHAMDALRYGTEPLRAVRRPPQDKPPGW